MHLRILALFITALAIAAVAAGCGDDDTASLTKAEFVKQGDKICLEANKEKEVEYVAFIKDLEKAGKQLTQGEEEELVRTIVVPAVEKQAEGLDDLGAPEGDEDKVDAIVVGLEEVAEEGEENPVGSKTASSPFAKTTQLASEYGFEYCGR